MRLRLVGLLGILWLSGCGGERLDDAWSTVSVIVRDALGPTETMPAGPRPRVLGFEASWAEARLDARGPLGPVSVARLTAQTVAPDREGSTRVVLRRGAYDEVRLWVVLAPTQPEDVALFVEGRQASTAWEIQVVEPLPVPVVLPEGLTLGEGDVRLEVSLDSAGWVSELDFGAAAEDRTIHLPEDDPALYSEFLANVAASAEVSGER